MHTAYFGMQGGFSIKHVLSVFLLGVMFFCAGLLSIKISKISNNDLISILNKLSVVVVALGFMSILVPMNFWGYEEYAKSIFPFAEPSHYAITVSGVLLATGFYLPFLMRSGLVISVFLLAVIYPSTALAVTCFYHGVCLLHAWFF